MSDKAILVGNKVVIENDLMKWADWFEKNLDRRFVDKTYVAAIRVSTVFLGLDHGFGLAKPRWFETMIFGDATFEDYQERYETWEEAQVGHLKAVRMVEEYYEG